MSATMTQRAIEFSSATLNVANFATYLTVFTSFLVPAAFFGRQQVATGRRDLHQARKHLRSAVIAALVAGAIAATAASKATERAPRASISGA